MGSGVDIQGKSIPGRGTVNAEALSWEPERLACSWNSEGPNSEWLEQG